MSITSRISSMEEHVTNAYNGLQGLGADLTNVDKNIENISMVLDDIYDSMPSVSGEGTSLTLDDTRVGKIKSTLKGNTSQTTYSGKNLFNIEGSYETGTGITYTKNADGSYTLNGTANGNNFLRGLCYLNEQHTISYTSNVSNSNVIIRTRTGTPSAQTGIQDQLAVSSTSGNLASSKQFDFVEISIVSGTTLNNFKIYIQLEKGSSVTSFEPYVGGTASPNPSYPQPVNVVSGDNEINVVGKNLFDKNNESFRWSDNTTVLYNAIYVGIGTYTMSSPNMPYFSQGKNMFILAGNVTSGANSNTNGVDKDTPRTITTTDGYITIANRYKYGNDQGVYHPQDYNWLLEKGSSATTYEPYQGNTYNIDLPVENLFDKDSATLNVGINTSNGNTYNDTNLFSTDYIPISINTTYRANSASTTGNRVFGACYDSNKSYLEAVSTGVGERIFTVTNANAKYVRITGQQINIDNYQLEKGTKANSYTPYGTTPIELCKIGNYQDYFYKGTGKNLLSIVPPTSSSMKKGITSTYDSATGEISFSGTTTESYPWLSDATLDKPIQIGTNLIFSTKETKSYQIIARLYDSNGGMDAVIISPNATSNTITTTREVTRIGILTNTNSGVTINDKLYLQLENGSTMTTFEPYGSKDKWCEYEAINKTILNSSSYDGRGDLAKANTYRYYFKAPNALVVTSTTAIIPLYSNLGISVSRERAYSGDIGVSYFSQANKMQFVFDETKSLSIDDLKTWLDNNYFEVYYILAVPTSKLITYQPLIDQLNLLEKAMSKDSQTNISQVNNDLPFIISASALKEWSV